MKRVYIAGSVLVAISFLAACAERDSVTAPSANAVALSPTSLIDFTDPNCYFDPFGHVPGGCFTKMTATLTVDS